MTTNLGWSGQVVDRLLDRNLCPVCASAQLMLGRCPACRADLSGQSGIDLWNASQHAAAALRTREEVRQRVPRVAVGEFVGALQTPAPSFTAPSSATGPSGPALPPRPPAVAAHAPDAASSATLQSVLATAGAALFAVAAIVFTFFNPELADRALRGWIVAAVTVAFLGAAWLLARRDLHSSAEAVGALGLIFVILDVQAIGALAPTGASSWLLAAPATGAAAVVMFLAARRSGIRVWLWASLVALALPPAMLGWGIGGVLPAAIGQLASAILAAALTSVLPRVGLQARTGPAGLAPEAGALTALQLLMTVTAMPLILLTAEPLLIALVLALAAMHALIAARTPLPKLWSLLAGLFAGSAAIAATIAIHDGAGIAIDVWWVPITAATALVLIVTAVAPLMRGVVRSTLSAGAGVVFVLVLAPSVTTTLGVGARLAMVFLETALRESESVLDGEAVATLYLGGAVASVCVGAAGLAAFAWILARRGATPALLGVVRLAAVALAAVAVAAFAALPMLAPPIAVAIALIASASAVVLSRTATPAMRGLVVAGGVLAGTVSIMLTWITPALVPTAGVATVVVLGLYAAFGPRGLRSLFVGCAYAYALIVLAGALGLAGMTGVAQLCLTASVGLLGAIVATFLPWVGARAWQALLIVASVPFGIAIAQVVVQRSGWTAVSTAVMFALALTLTLTRRPGLTLAVRTVAAGLLVPSAAVVVVCLGAELLAQSGSPVVLPVIAAMVALVLPSTGLVSAALLVRGRGARAAEAARVAVETSTLVTAAITVLLSFTRDAAGLGTACLVLSVLGVAGVLTGSFGRRRYGWWLAAAALTGALWSAWTLAEVTLPEAYLLPPALGAAVVAAVLTLRGVPATALFSAGLGTALVPLVILSALDAPTGGALSWRVIGLFASAIVLVVSAVQVCSSPATRARRLRPLSVPLAVGSAIAAFSATVQAVRWGVGIDVVAAWSAASVFLAAFTAGAAAMLVIAAAAQGVRRGAERMPALRDSRWLGVPAVLALMVAVWPAIERDWFVIWAMWMLMLALLAAMVVAARRAVRGVVAPPVPVLFALAFVTAVVAWSPRDLRVEWFSLPLGAMLLLAGLQARGATDAPARRARLGDWPATWSGSWSLLAPGVIVMLSASVVATFTDPLTWRAILVMVIALAAILWGSSRRLAAPFLIGLVVLPVENVFVFAVQLGRGIEAMPWWITLAVIGAVLLIIAVTSERRADEGGGVVARVRDLR